MGSLLLMFLVFFAPLLLFVAWLAASSCLGNRLRSVRPGWDSYGANYLRTMANSGPAMSEQIELDDMLAEPGTRRQFEEDD
ncbi:uncharacterized protein N7515_009882 [Penicillium bovifimosum]|uniref:Uncharacterized protein n=1 Tax=Penicillium bovifimosum TaxID=126998 RepID=A0A9W9GII9_9EURO|nr:uncharacterized protein N7515_009882 [Penicillium bovifimosum]KAJ5120494.1 hypothetical protein N7515_009882 [Penicillium bovifimosum]